jgi:SulP family sulfate permease
VLFVVARGLIDVPEIRRILKKEKGDRDESAVLLVTFFATLLIALEFAVFVGIALSLILRALRTSNP